MTQRRVLGIVASHRKLGNTEIVVKSVAEKLGPDWDLLLVRLPKLGILPCKGCYACLLPDKACNLEDDMTWLLERIHEADAVIFGAPNYALAPVGIVKMFADRAIQASGSYDHFRKKKTAVALTLGREEYRGYAETALASQVAIFGLDVVILERFYGTHPGEAGLSDDFEKRTQLMARALLDPDFRREVPRDRCPACFSDLFRIHPEGLECVVCNAVAKLDGVTWRFSPPHPKFTEEGRKAHKEWLLNKKEEYPRIRDRLQAIRERYRKGHWILPSRETKSTN